MMTDRFMDVIFNSIPADWRCVVTDPFIIFTHRVDGTRLYVYMKRGSLVTCWGTSRLDGWVAGKLLSMFPDVLPDVAATEAWDGTGIFSFRESENRQLAPVRWWGTESRVNID